MLDEEVEIEVEQIIKLAKEPVKKTLSLILEKLKSENGTIRLSAIEVLINFNQYPEAKAALIQTVQEDLDEDVRRAAVEGLRYFVGKDVGEVVTECLDDPDELVRIESIETLESLSYKPAVEKLSNLLITDESELVKNYAAEAVGILGGKHKKNLMKNRLALESSEYVQLGIMMGLYHMGEEEYLSNISSFLHSPDYQVRCATVNSLRSIANEGNVEYILRNIRSLARTEETVAVLSTITTAIKMIKEEFDL